MEGGHFNFWTRDFKPSQPAGAEQNSAERYARLSDAALRAEAHLNSVDKIKQAIIAAMKRGGSFFTAHKEGGSIVKWSDGRFIRSVYARIAI